MIRAEAGRAEAAPYRHGRCHEACHGAEADSAARHRLALLSGQLHGLSPAGKDQQWLWLVMDAEGKRLTSVGQTAAGDAITILDCRRKNPGAGNGTVLRIRKRGITGRKPRLRQNILYGKRPGGTKGADMEKSIEQTFAELDELAGKAGISDTTLEESLPVMRRV